jgi:peptidyl-prolyl cis-trans isomerase C
MHKDQHSFDKVSVILINARFVVHTIHSQLSGEISMINILRTGCHALAGIVAASMLFACSQEPEIGTTATEQTSSAAAEQQDGDVVARVGDQAIHFSELNTMLNSSAVVGLSIPALGTPQRDTVRITLLDKVVSANLIYLDALRKGIDKDPEYQQAMQRFTSAMLADAYVRDYMARNAAVTEEELQAYYADSVQPGTEMTDDLRTVLKASLQKEKAEEQRKVLKDELRQGSKIEVFAANIYPEGDAERADVAPVAKFGDQTISWGEVKDRMIAAGKGAVARDPLAMESDARLEYLQNEINTRLLAQKAREQGLDQDPAYRARYNEYAKTRLINLHRAKLANEMAPTDEELQAYFEANKERITVPEYRKVQMVMLNSEDEANSVKQRIESGEITMFQAASYHSVAPDAKQNLGEIGWIAKGKLKPELDAVVFRLEPAEVGGPVEAGGLWHLVTVQDVRDAQNAELEEERTRKLTRRYYIHEKLDDYVVNLRKNDFDVEVYQDTLIRLAQQEADMVKQMQEQAEAPGSVTKQRLEEMQNIYKSGEPLPGT